MERLSRLKKDEHNPIIVTAVLRQILLLNGIDDWAYSFDGYEDERHCMERDGNGWKVYFGERGKQKRCKSFNTQIEACEELIRRLGQDENQRMKMISEFQKQVAMPNGGQICGQAGQCAVAPKKKPRVVWKNRNNVYIVGAVANDIVTPETSRILKGTVEVKTSRGISVAAYKLSADNPKRNTVKGSLSKGIAAYKKDGVQKNRIREKMQG